MYKFFIKFTLLKLALCLIYSENAKASDSSQNLCSILGQKLKNKYRENSISIKTSFYYSLLKIEDHYQPTEYKFNYYYNPALDSYELENCVDGNYSEHGETAIFEITRLYPSVVNKSTLNKVYPSFKIYMEPIETNENSKSAGRWKVSAVESENCVEIIATSLISKFQEQHKIINRVVPSNFNNLITDMVASKICTAHYASLIDVFNELLEG